MGSTMRSSLMIAGPRTTITMAGKMQVTSGSSILVGILAASYSARICRL